MIIINQTLDYLVILGRDLPTLTNCKSFSVGCMVPHIHLGVDQARYDMFERKHQALERLTLEGAVELQVGLSNSQVKVPP